MYSSCLVIVVLLAGGGGAVGGSALVGRLQELVLMLRHVLCALANQPYGFHRDVGEEGVAAKLGQALDAVLERVNDVELFQAVRGSMTLHLCRKQNVSLKIYLRKSWTMAVVELKLRATMFSSASPAASA